MDGLYQELLSVQLRSLIDRAPAEPILHNRIRRLSIISL